MFVLFFTACLLATAVWTTDASVSRPETCNSWIPVTKAIEMSVRDISDLAMQCLVNDLCTGIACTGKNKNGAPAGTLEVTVDHCSLAQPTINVYINMPSLGLSQYNQTLQSGALIPFYKASKLVVAGEKGFLEPTIVKLKDSRASFSVHLKSTNKTKGVLSIFENQFIELAPCSPKSIHPAKGATNSGAPLSRLSAVDEKRCVIGKLNGCGDNEICQQSKATQTGLCACLRGYIRDPSGLCTSPHVPNTDDTTEGGGGDSADGSSNDSSYTALKIAIPVVLILPVSGLIGVAYKFRWFTRLRLRLRRTRVYEEMLIDGDEVSIPSVGSNPLA